MKLSDVDLHVHTDCSDGQYSVDEVLTKAKEKDLKVIGIVDHDTIKHFDALTKSKVALEMLQAGYQIFAGVEFSCKIGSIVMHLIAYSINHKDEIIINLIKQADELRLKKIDCYLEQLDQFGVKLTEEQIEALKSKSNVGRVDIAKCLVDNKVVASVSEAFDKLLMKNENANAYKLDARAVIDAVRADGGLVVIAHPYQIMEENNLTSEQTMQVWKTLVELGATGMECYYSLYNLETITKLITFAESCGLTVTMGSDFHGEKIKPNIAIGQIMLK